VPSVPTVYKLQFSVHLSVVAKRKAMGSVDRVMRRNGERATDIDTEMSGASLGSTALCGQENGRGTVYVRNVATFHSTDRQTDGQTLPSVDMFIVYSQKQAEEI